MLEFVFGMLNHLTLLIVQLQVIELHGGQVDDQYSSRVTHVLCEHQKSSTFQQVSS